MTGVQTCALPILIADYRSIGLTLGRHPLEMMRSQIDPKILRSADLTKTPDGAVVEVGGLVVARQRPETAKGIVFMLLEDERGTVNLIVPPPVYDRHRNLVRGELLLRAKGRLERREGVVNIVVVDICPLERRKAPRPGRAPGERRRLAVAELRAVAPAGHMFGRR